MLYVSHRRLRPLQLAAIISTALGTVTTTVVEAAPLMVAHCADDGSAGTLRNVIELAPDNSVIQIPLMCSTITLDQGTITIPATITNMYIVGQSPSETIIQPSTGVALAERRLFNGLQKGVLGLSQLTLRNGYYSGDHYAKGGCIYSTGSVGLNNAVVTGCTAKSSSQTVASAGGAICALGSVALVQSEVTNSRLIGEGSGQLIDNGGGIYAFQGLSATSSTISGNSGGFGGGFATSGPTTITRSTISGNVANLFSAGLIRTTGSVNITSSTIANNYASGYGSMVAYAPTTVTDSTIAFNTTKTAGDNNIGAGLFANTVTTNNSIFANNVVQSGASYDVVTNSLQASSPNLIVSTPDSLPPQTLTACPRLGLLANNGGPTKTISLLKNSPALDVGAANGQTTDQRGTGYPRTFGSGTDIGAYERQAGVADDVVFFSGFETKCD